MGLKFAFEPDNQSMKRYSALSLMPRTENFQFDELILNALALIWESPDVLSSDGLNMPIEQTCAGWVQKGRNLQKCVLDTVVTDCHTGFHSLCTLQCVTGLITSQGIRCWELPIPWELMGRALQSLHMVICVMLKVGPFQCFTAFFAILFTDKVQPLFKN